MPPHNITINMNNSSINRWMGVIDSKSRRSYTADSFVGIFPNDETQSVRALLSSEDVRVQKSTKSFFPSAGCVSENARCLEPTVAMVPYEPCDNLRRSTDCQS